MRDVFQRVRDRVRVVVHRVDAPVVAGAVVVRVADAVDGRVAHVHVRRGHVDLGAQDVLAVLVLAGLHVAEQVAAILRPGGCGTASSCRRAEIAAVRRPCPRRSGCRRRPGRRLIRYSAISYSWSK